MSFELLPLRNLIEPARLVRANADRFPILSMTMHYGLVDQERKFKKRIASIDTAQYKVTTRNQLVVGFPIDEGVLSFQTLYDKAIVSPAYDVWDLSDKHAVDCRYLERFLRSPRALAFYRSKLRGTTARRRSLPDEVFLSLEVLLPLIGEQQRIVELLDRVDEMRAKHRAALAQLDSLVQAIFMDMFRDPATNPEGWPLLPVSDYVAEFQGGRSLESESGESTVTRNRVLKVSAVTGMEFLPNESKPVPDSYEPPRDHFVRPGDLLFSRANTTELVGAVAYVDATPMNLLLPDKLWRFVWRQPELTDPLFVWALFQTGPVRYEIGRRATGTSGSLKNISQKKVLGIRTIVPPLSLQREFGRCLAMVEKLKSTHRASLTALDALFSSLQHRAFRGEL